MKLNQITFPVNDMKAACEFYLTLGFTQIVDTPHYARFETPDQYSTFSLALSAQTNTSGATIYFESDDLDNWVKKLIDKGIKFDQMPTEQSYLWREASLEDPSGNKIKLYYAGDNRLNPPWRVDIKN